jgi:hypothetical protein
VLCLQTTRSSNCVRDCSESLLVNIGSTRKRGGKAFSRTKRPYEPKPATVAVPKLDKFGRLRKPRAARELALSVLYAAFVSGVHPLKVFDDRVKQRVAAHS